MRTYTENGYTLSISPCNSSQAYVGTILETGINFYCDTIGEVFREFGEIVKELNCSNDYSTCKNCASQ